MHENGSRQLEYFPIMICDNMTYKKNHWYRKQIAGPTNEASTTIYLNIPITRTELRGLPPADRFTHVGSTPLLNSKLPII